jgi:N-glycosylase/DNA lyase
LLECNLGYRAKYIKKASQIIVEDQINLTDLRKMSYTEARKILQSLPGIGNKVADCILLFSLNKLEAFPVDVWIKRILQSHYRHHFTTPKEALSLTPRIYSEFSTFGRKYFGQYAGYAQEYLYAYFSSRCIKCNTV